MAMHSAKAKFKINRRLLEGVNNNLNLFKGLIILCKKINIEKIFTSYNYVSRVKVRFAGEHQFLNAVILTLSEC